MVVIHYRPTNMIFETLFYLLIWESQLRVSHETPSHNLRGHSKTTATRKEDIMDKWMAWKISFRKRYNSEYWEEVRLNEWKQNLILVEDHNMAFERGKELYSIEMNMFADNFAAVLRSFLLPGIPVTDFEEVLIPIRLPDRHVPDSMNWSSHACSPELFRAKVSPPFGWAFSAAKTLEVHIARRLGVCESLSRQELIDCSPQYGNGSHSTMDAFWYILWDGLTNSTDYPMRRYRKGHCERKEDSSFVRIRDFQLLQPEDEDNLKVAVAFLGPISVSIKVTNRFFLYKTGVFFDPFCKMGRLAVNHALVLMGYGSDPIAGDYWIVQNSWGPKWGENGYSRMARNTFSNCGIAAAALYPVL